MTRRLEWLWWGSLLGVSVLPLGSVVGHKEVQTDMCCTTLLLYHDGRFVLAAVVWLGVVGAGLVCRRTRLRAPVATLALVGVWLTFAYLAGTEPSQDWRFDDARTFAPTCIQLC